MRVTHLENGDLIISKGTKPVFVILGIIAFLLLSKDAFVWLFSVDDIHGNRFLAIAVVILTLLFFYRVLSLSSQFHFRHDEMSLEYHVQYPFSNRKGVVSVQSIEEAILETDSEGSSRIIIKCAETEIPMSCTVDGSEDYNSVVFNIN